MPETSLYDRLGGVFAIAAVVDHFSDAVIRNPAVGRGSKNEALDEWSTKEAATRLPGLKFMRTLWVCAVAAALVLGVVNPSASGMGGGGFALVYSAADRKVTALDFREISPAQFDEVAAELARSLDAFKVPEQEKSEVLAAFAAHKGEVTEGFMAIA